jgi:hypothetical protein
MKKPISSLKRKGIIMENKSNSNPWKSHKEDIKKFLEKEKQEYLEIPFSFEIGEKVLISKYRNEKRVGEVIKHSFKSYSVSDELGNKYRIDKKSNYGMPNWTFEIGTTERMKVGESVHIEKYIENTDNI